MICLEFCLRLNFIKSICNSYLLSRTTLTISAPALMTVIGEHIHVTQVEVKGQVENRVNTGRNTVGDE